MNARGAAPKRSDAPLNASLHDCARFLAADSRGTEAKALGAQLKRILVGKKDAVAAAKDYLDEIGRAHV